MTQAKSQSRKKSQILVAKAGYGSLLQEELQDLGLSKGLLIDQDALAFPEAQATPKIPETIFARQFLPNALAVAGVGDKADFVLERFKVASQRSNRKQGRWTLHSFALEDNQANVLAKGLEKAVLRGVRTQLGRFFQRYVTPEAFLKEPPAANDFVVQLYVTMAGDVWFSVGSFSAGISPYVGGTLRMRAKANSPSRSARKLEEAFHELGIEPKAGETAVDLGAAPGGWTFSLARRGVSVIAVDALDMDLPNTKVFKENVTHLRENGLKYRPPFAVDWLVCDMIVASRETVRVLDHWLAEKWLRHFVVNVKLPKIKPWLAVKEAIAAVERHAGVSVRARHLFHDRHEVTLFGGFDDKRLVEADLKEVFENKSKSHP